MSSLDMRALRNMASLNILNGIPREVFDTMSHKQALIMNFTCPRKFIKMPESKCAYHTHRASLVYQMSLNFKDMSDEIRGVFESEHLTISIKKRHDIDDWGSLFTKNHKIDINDGEVHCVILQFTDKNGELHRNGFGFSAIQ